MTKPKKVSKKKPAPAPSSAEESEEQLSPRHSPQPGPARDQSPDYRSDEAGSPKPRSPTHVPENVEAHRADPPVQSDQSGSESSRSSSYESDGGSGEDLNVVSGDNKEPANPSPERVDISSDSEPETGAIGNPNVHFLPNPPSGFSFYNESGLRVIVLNSSEFDVCC